MQISAPHAQQRAGARELARAQHLERQLAKYQAPYRERVRALAARHPWLKDLAASFPALLFTLAVPWRGLDVELVIESLVAGAPLRELAERARVPMWLRPVEPEAFTEVMPELPDGDLFRRQIANHLPSSPKKFAQWAQLVSNAFIWADEAVALWAAREHHRHPLDVTPRSVLAVCLWAWYTREETRHGPWPPARAWSPSLAFEGARIEAVNWLCSADMYLAMGDDIIEDMWLTPATVAGFEFVPVRSARAIVEEGQAMDNCLERFGVDLSSSRIWSVRTGDQRVATLEIGLRSGDPIVSIRELSAKSNKNASSEVWLATREWLNSHPARMFPTGEEVCSDQPPRRDAWLALWRPYWIAKARIPSWLPLAPSWDTIYDLRSAGTRRRRRRRRRLQ